MSTVMASHCAESDVRRMWDWPTYRTVWTVTKPVLQRGRRTQECRLLNYSRRLWGRQPTLKITSNSCMIYEVILVGEVNPFNNAT